MSSAERFTSLLLHSLGAVHVPRLLRELPGPLLIHVSDTPSCFYPTLVRILDRLRPAWLVISGDLADEVKLELNPALAPRYAARLSALHELLAPRLAREPRGLPGLGTRLVLAVGNHDDGQLVERLFPEALVVRGAARFQAGGCACAVSHWAHLAEKSDAEYLFYGHDLARLSGRDGRRVYCNGIQWINVLDLGSGCTYRLPYPAGIDAERLLRRKIGL